MRARPKAALGDARIARQVRGNGKQPAEHRPVRIGQIGCGNVLGLFQLGNMPSEKARENARRYAEAVMPLVNQALPNSRVPMPVARPFPDRS